jgi:hypothetical protein
MCNHDWQPIPGWRARYRCSKCNVIGAKFGIVPGSRSHSLAIEPYRCGERCDGGRCSELAVEKVWGEKLRCAAHVPHASPTARARKELAPVRAAEAVPVRLRLVRAQQD